MGNNFLKPSIKVIKQKDGGQAIANALEILTKKAVYVGIPQGNNHPDEHGGIGNAELGWLHTMGFTTFRKWVLGKYLDRFKSNKQKASAIQAYLHSIGDPFLRVPARPFLQPALKAHMFEIVKRQKAIYLAAFYKPETVPIKMQALGEYCRDIVKAWFVDPHNGWPKNAPWVVKIKGSDKPLIDTGSLQNSIDYVIR